MRSPQVCLIAAQLADYTQLKSTDPSKTIHIWYFELK